MQNYHYPDFNDSLIVKFLAEFEKNEGYWEESEKQLNSRVIQLFHEIPGFSFDSFLDAGSGKGRLIHVFERYFRKIVALEPDPDRYQDTLMTIQKLGLQQKVEAINRSAEVFQHTHGFDFILCSHVIQHIHTGSVIPLLGNLGKHLNSSGLMMITTCHSTTHEDTYGKDYLENGIPMRIVIEKDEYNQLISANGILPLHFFNAEKLISDLLDIGLRTIDFRVFHIAKEERDVFNIVDIDTYINANPGLQKLHGIDMCLLVQKV
jgi:cyclopropane fatty-acyl-phospholipid synthase-like methyltransferase